MKKVTHWTGLTMEWPRNSINWSFVKSALATRREQRDLTRLGYRQCEPFWEINRGSMMGQRIVDVRISVCGQYVWAKAGLPGERESG